MENIPLKTFSEDEEIKPDQTQPEEPTVVVENIALGDNSIPIKCKRCHQVFSATEFAHTKCYYHPGKYNQSINDDWGWTCCRKDVYASLNLIEFFDTSDPLFSTKLRDKIREAAKNFSEKHGDKILNHEHYNAVGNEEDEELEEEAFEEDFDAESYLNPHSEKTGQSSNNNVNNNTSTTPNSPPKPISQLVAVNENSEKSLTTLSPSAMNKESRFYKYYSRKRMDQTMTVLEKIQFRDDPELSPLLPDSIGCLIADHHIVDETYMIHLNKFPIVDPHAQSSASAPKRKRPLPQEIVAKKLGDTRHKLPEFLSLEFQSNQETEQTTEKQESNKEETESKKEEKEEEKESKEEEEKGEKEEKIPDYIEHKIEKGDSLINISFKYNVPIAVLRKVNFLPNGDFIFHRQTLLIPTNGKSIRPISKEPTQQELTLNFKSKVGCSLEEAKFYLNEAEWDSERAKQLFLKDRNWEKDQQENFHPSTLFVDPQKNQPPSRNHLFDCLSSSKSVSAWC